MSYSFKKYVDAKANLKKKIIECIQNIRDSFNAESIVSKNNETLNNIKEFTIIAQSRKGPKFLEVLFKDSIEELFINDKGFIVNVITEHAIPIFFKRKKDSIIHYIHFDDALYFGTTAESTAKEIDKYCELYNITHKQKSFYCAIKSNKTKSGLDDSLGEIYPKTSVSNGDEHFFVKELLSDIRKLNCFFELEFPVIEYVLNQEIEFSILYQKICNLYDPTRICKVEHVENNSITILLDNIGGSLFNKLRIRIDSKVAKIIAIAPRTIPNEFHTLRYIFDNGNPLAKLWHMIYSHISYDDNVLSYSEETDRRRDKTAIMFANYLYSYDTFIQEKKNIENVLNEIGGKCEFKGVQSRDLIYLTGDYELSKTIKEELDNIYTSGLSCGIPNYKILLTPFNEQIFEKSSKEFTDKKKFEMNFKNEVMLKQCKNLEEALSVLSFNQYIFLDQLTRETEKAKATRLRFGYTFDSLINILRRFQPFIGEIKNLTLNLHTWIDRKIDEGCIVPQYIIDEKSNHWIRVFRPGENEDTLLGHLARFAVFVLEKSWETMNLGWIFIDEYERNLIKAFITIKEDGRKIIESKNISLKIEDEKLVIEYDNYKNKEYVSDYMKRMSIISINDNIVKVLPRIIETNLTDATTLSDDDEKGIIAEISKKELEYMSYKLNI